MYGNNGCGRVWSRRWGKDGAGNGRGIGQFMGQWIRGGRGRCAAGHAVGIGKWNGAGMGTVAEAWMGMDSGRGCGMDVAENGAVIRGRGRSGDWAAGIGQRE